MHSTYHTILSPDSYSISRATAKGDIETHLEIEVRNVTYRLTPLTDYFTTEIWINGQKAGNATDDGHGIKYKNLNLKRQELLRTAESYSKYFPSPKEIYGPDHSRVRLNFNGLIGLLVKEHIDGKEMGKRGFWRKVEKASVNSIVYGRWFRPFLQIKYDAPLEKFQNTRQGMKILSDAIADLREKLEPGEAIFNRNLNGDLQALIEGPWEKTPRRKSPKSPRQVDPPEKAKSKGRRQG